MSTYTVDLEANNLLNNETVDYTASPFKLKDSFKMHCIVVENHETEELIAFYDGETILLDGRNYQTAGVYGTYTLSDYKPVEYTHFQLKDFPSWLEQVKMSSVVGHNIINYDLLVFKMYYKIPYTVGIDGKDTFGNKDVVIEDTLVTAKTLEPDRFGGNSLDELSKKVGVRKVQFRKSIKKEDRFKEFAEDMLYYCIRDVKANTAVYKWLESEKSGWDWSDPILTEKLIAEIVTRQEHRGFKFFEDRAVAAVKELDELKHKSRETVNPVLPKRNATKTFMKDYTPPKIQFKANGEHSANLVKFVSKFGGKFETEAKDCRKVSLLGKAYDLPLPLEPLVTEMPMDIDNSSYIKSWLMRDFGWQPLEWKEKDLSKHSKFKYRLSWEEFEPAVDRYVKQTEEFGWGVDRAERLRTTPENIAKALFDLFRKGRPCKVLTSPSFTVGQNKDLCSNLEKISSKFPYAKMVVEYYTYKHRRSAILGGGAELDDDTDAEKGYMANVRDDGRIATPADTCGAASARMKHRVVANVPRPTSLYGAPLRNLFGVDEDFIQVGYDFDSLEARIESHYCWLFDETKKYCESLLQAKPNDVHTLTAKQISGIINEAFSRSNAKSIKYGVSYGASVQRVAKIVGCDMATAKQIFDAFWEAAKPLERFKNFVSSQWETKFDKKYIKGVDGRKVMTRSQHSLVNYSFQNAGVMAAKRAAIIHEHKLRQEGLVVDFFSEDWKNKEFFQQLIMYHDESQGEVSKSLVKFKTFPYTEENEEEVAKIALQWKEATEKSSGKILSDVGHTRPHPALRQLTNPL